MAVKIFVIDLPEFAPLIEALRTEASVSLKAPVAGYWQIDAGPSLSLSRKGLGLNLALWYSMLAGGFCGCLTEYGRDTLTIIEERTA